MKNEKENLLSIHLFTCAIQHHVNDQQQSVDAVENLGTYLTICRI